MAFSSSQPQNFNLLQTNNYKIVINRLPSTIFYTQTFKSPELIFPAIEQSTPFIKIHHSASELQVGPMEFTFKVDENMQNYREILDWMRGLGFPETTNQYKDLKYTNNKDGNKGLKSDCSVEIMTSSSVPNKEIYMHDIFPIYLSGLTFETRNKNVNYISATVRFSVRDFTINDVIS